ncbi:MAG: MgtC/SapB family protein [Clostridiales bacterium]|nr:MgtC/SapB family protein [Clostridiales bacterium]
MLAVFDGLREMTFVSLVFRLAFAVVCGALIGIERQYKYRPSGLRTHVLVCLGAAMTTVTGLYLWLCMHYYTDVARLGAQVIAGVGFIGAGTIISSRTGKRVKGLTTAAGLWTVGIIGLACGLAYFEAAAYTTILVLVVEIFLSRLEHRFMVTAKRISLYVEYSEELSVNELLSQFKRFNTKVTDMRLMRFSKNNQKNTAAIFALEMTKNTDYHTLVQEISALEGLLFTGWGKDGLRF